MSLDQDVGDGDLVLQVRPLATMSRIFVSAQIVPGPAVERAGTHARNEVGDQVVA